MKLTKIVTLLAASVLTLASIQGDVASAHGVDQLSHAALTERRLLASQAKLSYENCKNTGHVQEMENRVAQRRLTKLNQLRAELQRRRRRLDATEVLAKSHQRNASEIRESPVSATIDPTKLFGSTPKCVLQPDVTHGPYYVKGELIRSDIREAQPGVDLYTEIQVIDTTTCTPVENLFLDFWHTNATGVYSGVVASGNGNAADQSNLNTTFGRGLHPTNSDGIAQFTTKFPGHYAGRATHIHVMGNVNGTVLSNNTYAGSNVVNVGQLFFDQDLVEAVEATAPYASNDAIFTKNCVDRLFMQSADGGFDPVVNYVYVGDTVEDGIFSWITIGVDMAATKAVSAAATYTASGGIVSSTNNTHMRPGNEQDGRVPRAPGPKADDTGNATVGARVIDDEPKARSAVFSFFFFVASASALVAFLYKFPTKKNPRKMYAPMMSA